MLYNVPNIILMNFENKFICFSKCGIDGLMDLVWLFGFCTRDGFYSVFLNCSHFASLFLIFLIIFSCFVFGFQIDTNFIIIFFWWILNNTKLIRHDVFNYHPSVVFLRCYKVKKHMVAFYDSDGMMEEMKENGRNIHNIFIKIVWNFYKNKSKIKVFSFLYGWNVSLILTLIFILFLKSGKLSITIYFFIIILFFNIIFLTWNFLFFHINLLFIKIIFIFSSKGKLLCC